MNKTTNKILAIVMLIAVLFSFMPFNVLISYAFDVSEEDCQKHEYGDYTVKTEATCTAEGVMVKQCKHCGAEEEESIKKLDHSYVYENVEATCKEDAYKKGICSVCGDIEKKDIDVGSHEKVDHKWASTGKCTVCGTDHTKHVWKDGICDVCKYVCQHTEENKYVTIEENAKTPTCTEAGNKAGKGCEICREVLVDGDTIPAVGHNIDTTTGKCTVCGEGECASHDWTDNNGVCKTCGYKCSHVNEKGETTFADVEKTGKDVTCKTDGKEPDVKCSTCGYEKEGAVISANGRSHTSDKKLTTEKEATCVKDGFEAEHCTECGAFIEGTEKTIFATGAHDYPDGKTETDWTIELAATCSAYGAKYLSCKVCGQAGPKTVIDKDPNAHVYSAETGKCTLCSIGECDHSNTKLVGGKPATCTEKGKNADTVCKDCGFVVLAGGEIPMLEHEYEGYTLIQEATCTTPGIMAQVCKNCEFKNEETIKETSKKAHEYGATTVIKKATCTENQVVGEKCKNCNTVSNEKEVENTALGHDNTKKTTTPATTKKGSIVTSCTRCGKVASKQVITNIKSIVLSKTSYTYTGKAIKPGVTVKDADGKVIDSKYYTVTYKDNKNIGTATATITFKGIYSGTFTRTFKINPAKIKSIVLSQTSYTYTGMAIKPGVTVKDTNGKVIDSKYYTVTYKNNKNIGKATVTITFKGIYSGTYTRTFKINPTKVTGTKVKETTIYTATISWKKAEGNVTGYKVYVWNSDTNSYKLYANVKGTSIKVKGLKRNATSKFQVKAYTTVDGANYIGASSGVFTAKTKNK